MVPVTETEVGPSALAEYGDETLRHNVHPEGWRNPRPASRYNLVVLGGGSTVGILTALEAARAGAKVALVERGVLGGVCLNTGCISSKAIIRTSRLYADMRDAMKYGAVCPAVRPDFGAAMDRMQRVRGRASRRRSAQELTAHGIDVFFGEGKFADPNTIRVNGTQLRFKRALVATGARPSIPPIPGLAESGYLTNENVFELSQCPGSLLVIGGGPFGCELGQAFARLGCHVTIAQDEPLFLSQEERDAAQILSDALTRDGVDIHLNTQTTGVRKRGAETVVDLQTDDIRRKFQLTRFW